MEPVAELIKKALPLSNRKRIGGNEATPFLIYDGLTK